MAKSSKLLHGTFCGDENYVLLLFSKSQVDRELKFRFPPPDASSGEQARFVVTSCVRSVDETLSAGNENNFQRLTPLQKEKTHGSFGVQKTRGADR
jgi:hypothetical protein